MKKAYTITIALLFTCMMHASAQVETLWTNAFPDVVQWQIVTAYGNYLVSTPNQLMGVDADTGEIIWGNATFGNIARENVQQVGASPLIAINKDGALYMLDPFSGKVKFNSYQAGIDEVRDQFVLYKANGILISGRSGKKDMLLMSSMSTGEVVWKIEDDYGRLVTANDLSANELLIVTIFHNYKVNPQNGEVIWKNDVSEANEQLEKLGGLGQLMKQAASNVAQDIDFNVEFYRHPSQPVFYVASERESQSSGFSSSTSTTPTFETSYSAFSLQDGSRIWDEELVVRGRMGPIYFHERGLVILPNDGSNSKINLYDYESKEGLWGKKGRGLKIKGGVYSYAEVGDGLMVVSQNLNNKNFISYLDLNSGTLTFDKPVKVDGTVMLTENTAKGLLYVTTEEINILNKNTGELILEDPINTNPSLVASMGSDLYAFDLRYSVLKKLDKKTGKVQVMTNQDIKFDGKEDPQYISLRENGILLSASQNIALVDYDGNITYQKYFEAPREPGIIRALRYAQAVRAAYIGASAYAGAAAFQTAGQQMKAEDPAGGAFVQEIGNAYGELGDAATDFARQAFQKASARFKATQEADDYMVMLTREDKTNKLIKVSKDTGEVQATIDLGKDRNPNYTMDGVTDQVFYQTEPNTITAYQF